MVTLTRDTVVDRPNNPDIDYTPEQMRHYGITAYLITGGIIPLIPGLILVIVSRTKKKHYVMGDAVDSGEDHMLYVGLAFGGFGLILLFNGLFCLLTIKFGKEECNPWFRIRCQDLDTDPPEAYPNADEVIVGDAINPSTEHPHVHLYTNNNRQSAVVDTVMQTLPTYGVVVHNDEQQDPHAPTTESVGDLPPYLSAHDSPKAYT